MHLYINLTLEILYFVENSNFIFELRGMLFKSFLTV